jgi:hypothetical protein
MDNKFNEYTNCQACGSENFNSDLQTIKLSGFIYPICVCKTCISRTAEDSFKDAAELLNDIVAVAVSNNDPESRLNMIKAIIGE